MTRPTIAPQWRDARTSVRPRCRVMTSSRGAARGGSNGQRARVTSSSASSSRIDSVRDEADRRRLAEIDEFVTHDDADVDGELSSCATLAPTSLSTGRAGAPRLLLSWGGRTSRASRTEADFDDVQCLLAGHLIGSLEKVSL